MVESQVRVSWMWSASFEVRGNYKLVISTMCSILKSRTVWTLVFMFVVGGVNALTKVLPGDVVAPLMGFLTLLGTYFHVNPSQQYNEVPQNA